MMKIWNSVDNNQCEYVWVICKFCQRRELVNLRDFGTHCCCNEFCYNKFMYLELWHVFITLSA